MKYILALITLAAVIIAGILYYDGSANISDSTPSATSTPQSSVPVDIIPDVPSVVYQNSTYHFSVAYPATGSILTGTDGNFAGFLPLTATPVIAFTLPASLFEGTNLGTAGVYIGATTSPVVVATCTSASKSMDETAASSTTYGGATYNIFTSTGVGAGNIYDEKTFRTLRGGVCFEIVEMLHSGQIGNYTPGTTKEYDKPTFAGYLDGIVKTFMFVTAPTAPTY